MGDASSERLIEHEQLAARIGLAEVQGLDGGPVQLRSFWRDAPTVNVFVRQFGCLFCHQMVDDAVEWIPAIRSRGARLVIVGNGTQEQARSFFEAKGLPVECASVVTDPARNSYRAAEMNRGFRRTFWHKGAKAAYREARRKGHRITGWLGDLTQLGGLAVIRPPAHLAYLHRSRFAGDHPKRDEVFAALR